MYTITAKQFSSGLPSRIKIGPVEYQIIMETEPTAPGPEEGERVPVYGMVNFKKAEITIDSELVPAMQWQCFWHEVLHVMMEQAGLANDCEGEIDALAYKLLDILMDNGWLTVKGKFLALETSVSTGRDLGVPASYNTLYGLGKRDE